MTPASTWTALLTLLPATLFGADVSSKVIDGLGRPVTNAVVDIHWLKSVSPKDVRKVNLVRLVSDREGQVKGKYDETAVPAGEDVWVEISRDGFSGYSTTGLKPEFVLEREFGATDIQRIAALEGPVQRDELRELLAGQFDDSSEGIADLVFLQEHRFRSALRDLVSDPKVGPAAAGVLAFIGVPEDLRLIVEHAPPPKGELFDNRWAYGVACALLAPATEKEWDFLRNCALNKYDDLWVDAGAIQTLKLIASPKSKEILTAVGKVNKDRSDEVEAAIRYIDSKPESLSDPDLVEAAKKAARAIGIGQWKGNKKPRFNQQEDEALVDCEFVAGRDRLTYTATFHKTEGKWQLRGMRETMQALMAKEVE